MPTGIILRGRCARCDFAEVRLGHPCPRCGLKHEADPAQPVFIDGRYELEAELGRGAMGVVYRARDTWLRRALALKLISPSRSDDPDAASRFHREGMALASIRSQYVVQVYAFGVHEEAYFLAMEYVAGKNLDRILDEHQQHGALIPVHRALTILERIAEGVTAVHQAGIIHRDIKPDNIVIEQGTGRPVLVDFGLASPGEEESGDLIGGTPHFMAPEQAGLLRGIGSVTPKADLYAFACVAFVMLTGRVPFDADNSIQVLLKHAREAPPAVSSIRPELAAFDAALARSLAKDPAARHASCVELVRDLYRAHGEHDGSVPPVQSAPPISAGERALRALIIDDDPAFAKLAQRAVQLALYGKPVHIETANSGAEGLTRAQRNAPDLVILDFDMPGLDGASTLSRMRALPHGGGARVVVVSARLGPEDRWRFSVLGVTDFLSKPIDLESFIEYLETMIAAINGSTPNVPP